MRAIDGYARQLNHFVANAATGSGPSHTNESSRYEKEV